MNKKTFTFVLMTLLSFVGVKADVIPSAYYSEPAAGTFYLYNVSQGKYLERLGNNFPGMTATPVAVTLTAATDGYTIKFSDGKFLHTGHWNGQYLWTDGEAGSANEQVWSFTLIENNVYQLKRTVEETVNGKTGTFYANGTNADITTTDDCQWALITEGGYYSYLASTTATIPTKYYTTTPTAGTYYLYSPYADCFIADGNNYVALSNTPEALTLTASGENFGVQMKDGNYMKYGDGGKLGNAWADGTESDPWTFESFHGATGLFFLKDIGQTSYLYAFSTEAAQKGAQLWGTAETNNTRYAWTLISEENYKAWQNSFVLSDETGYSATKDIYNVNPTMQRTMNAGTWNTLVLPFDMTIPSGWTVVEPTSFEGGTLTFGTASSIVAGKPYLVKPTGDVTNIAATGVTLKIDLQETSVNDGALTMTGTYTKMDAVPTGSYVLGTDNKLHKVNSTVSLNPFRAYFTIAGEAPTRIALNFGDGTTGVQSVATSSQQAGKLYDMQGRRVKQPAKGMYIVNGKKVIIK